MIIKEAHPGRVRENNIIKKMNCYHEHYDMTSFLLSEIAEKISAILVGDGNTIIKNVAPLYRATSEELSYLTNSAYEKHLVNTKAAAVILSEKCATICPVPALIVDQPELAFARISALFDQQPKPLPGIHPAAVIAKSARISPSASIGANCVIGEHVVIGDNTTVMPGVIIHDGSIVGDHCFFYSRVTIYHGVVIHNRVMLHSGVVIGADGFGLAQDKGRFEKIPQLGTVIIHDDVEIGANTCVDRGALDNTIIEMGVKIDNLVQIAHNVVIGAYTVIAACVGIAGSATIGRHCIIGGAAIINGHISLCDGVILTGSSEASKSVTEPGVYSSGLGLAPNAEWRRNAVRFRNLDKWTKMVNKAMGISKEKELV